MTEEELKDQDGEEGEAETGMSEAEKAALIQSIENRIASGELDEPTFHSFVVGELYPLLADGTLDQTTFVHLVQTWALRHYPYDWSLKMYG